MARKKNEAKKTRDLVAKMDFEAHALLDESKTVKELVTRLGIFANVARYLGVRAKLADPETMEGDGLLDAYRTRIENAHGALAVGKTGRSNSRGDDGESAGDAPALDSSNGGEVLTALKARIPRADDRRSNVDSGGSGSAESAIAGSNRLVLSNVGGDAAIDFDEPHSGDEF